MGWTLNEIIAGIPSERQAKIDARYRDMKGEIKRLQESRTNASRSPANASSTREDEK